MKILMLTPYLPYPPSSGGQIRSYNLIKHLSRKHKITLFSLIKGEQEKFYIDELKNFCQEVYVFNRPEKPWTFSNILRTGFSRHPFLVVRNFSPLEKNAVADILKRKQFDIIHAETFYVSPHIPQTKIPIVLVDQTIEYQVYQHFVENFRINFLKPLLMLDVYKIKYWEIYYWKKAARVVAVSQKDAATMKNLVKNLRVTVVPNGVGEDLIGNLPVHYSKNILFVGNYAWLQNKEAVNILAKKIFPRILEQIPDAKLTIAGQNIQKINCLEGKNIVIRDLKIDDISGIKQEFANAGILIAPLYGPGGTRLKILGAMSAMLPVVTTPIGIEGIDVEHKESVLCGNTPEDLTKLAIRLLKDKKLYDKIAFNARGIIESKYSYKNIAKRLDFLYQEIINEQAIS